MSESVPSRARPRAVAALVALVTIAFALSGCVNIKNVNGVQQDTIGGVNIGVVLCASGSTDCAGNGNSGIAAVSDNTNVPLQLLVAYRVSAGAVAPATLRFFDDDGLGPLFTRDAGYTAELQRLAPAPAGQEWFGYLSSAFTYNGVSTVKSAPILTRFGLPGNTGAPFASPFRLQAVAGFRLVTDSLLATRPVACGASLTTVNDSGYCVDSPAPADIPSSLSAPTRDLGVKAGAAQTTAAGQVASLPFTLQFAGATSPTFLFGLSATTTIPGASAAVTPSSLVPANNDPTTAIVTVPVPAGTAPGTYPVTLTATLGTQTRIATSSIVVPGPPGGPGGGTTGGLPSLSNLSVSPKSIFRFRGAKPATLKVTLSQAGTLKVAVTRAAQGRRKNGKCVAPTGALIRNGATKCTRFVSVTTITKANLAAGVRSVTFSGRNRVPGLYRLRVTVRAAGLVSLPRTITVTVKP